MNRATLLLFVGMLGFQSHAAGSLILPGPASFDTDVVGHTNWGIQFDALADSVITGFDVHPQDDAGLTEVWNVTDGIRIYSNGHGPNTGGFSYFNLNIQLEAGKTYQILGFNILPTIPGSNGRQVLHSMPESNAHISVTHGVFSDQLVAGVWSNFNNIHTVPEPSTYAALASLSLIGLAIYRRHRSNF